MADTNLTSTLWDISEEYVRLAQSITDLAEENDGIVPDEALDVLDKLEGTLDEKGARCCLTLLALKQRAKNVDENVREEVKRLRAVKGRAQAELDNWVAYLVRSLERAGVTEAGTEEYGIKLKTNPPSVDDRKLDVDAVPDEFCDLTVKIPADQYGAILYAIEFAKEAALDAYSDERSSDEDDVIQLRPDRWQAKRSVRKADIVDAWKKSSGAHATPGAPVIQKVGVKTT